VAFTATGFACPPLADDFIYGLKPVALRLNSKTSAADSAYSIFVMPVNPPLLESPSGAKTNTPGIAGKLKL